MSAVRRAALLAVTCALAGAGFAAPADAFHICVTAPGAPEVCVCTRPLDHNCGHGSRD